LRDVFVINADRRASVAPASADQFSEVMADPKRGFGIRKFL